ncbi:hypothetical protein [Pseudomarimonas salicorniae]|uniref:Uncharacterized protein n=1 Tax=Pseudomarimonas salicorniae TaxID=2933270 RepID=A0ABT0GDF2_9GAMM|nr:hypothetical protein [Lysobacter sp. CAU 1642]MCK7592581.1 hypothetical protein [Lysobacter sp. CAU 1642]
MRSFTPATLLALIPLAVAAQPNKPETVTTIELGIEHSLPMAREAGAKAAAKPEFAIVEEDGHLIPLHLHVAADGSSRIECREDHAVQRQSATSAAGESRR